MLSKTTGQIGETAGSDTEDGREDGIENTMPLVS